MGWLDPGTGKQGRDCFLMGKFGDFVICEFFLFFFIRLVMWVSVGYSCLLLLFMACLMNLFLHLSCFSLLL
jgi:hypothetical protein